MQVSWNIYNNWNEIHNQAKLYFAKKAYESINL